jgi:very-short-patch-repair endonuclease
MMTRAEALFWAQVRAGRLHGLKFRRQVPIAPYIVDFLCPRQRLIIELDGAPHDDPARREADRLRDAGLRAQGFTIMRFTNDEVLGNCDEVLRRLVAAVSDGPSPAPLRGAPSPAEGERVA